MKPLYIWAGGKNKMIPKYLENPGIPSDKTTFIEPFFGGGAMTIWMYKNRPNIKNFVFNDIKEELIGIYDAIKYDVQSFVEKMDELERPYIPLDKSDKKEYYYKLRHEYQTDYKKWGKTEESAVLYFLMRTCFNGIWQEMKIGEGRFGTPAGLCNQTDTVYDKKNVQEWHEFLQNAEYYCGDWSEVNGYDDAFYFMDPPYRDSFTSYGEGNDDEMQKKIVEFCKKEDAKGNHVFLCNRKEDNFFEEIKGDLDMKLYDITYTAGKRKREENGFSAKKAVEVLLHSKSINKPNLEDYL